MMRQHVLLAGTLLMLLVIPISGQKNREASKQISDVNKKLSLKDDDVEDVLDYFESVKGQFEKLKGQTEGDYMSRIQTLTWGGLVFRGRALSQILIVLPLTPKYLPERKSFLFSGYDGPLMIQKRKTPKSRRDSEMIPLQLVKRSGETWIPIGASDLSLPSIMMDPAVIVKNDPADVEAEQADMRLGVRGFPVSTKGGLQFKATDTVIFNARSGRVYRDSTVRRLADNTWLLRAIGSQPEFKSAVAPNLQFFEDGSRVGGRGVCNNFGGNLEVYGDKISITKIFTTLVGCGPDTIERKYYENLSEANRYKGEHEKLYLYKDEELLLTFVAKSTITN